MKFILSFILITTVMNSMANIVYVDNFDAVYSWGINQSYDFDINSDGELDIRLITTNGASQTFFGKWNNYGWNRVQAFDNVDNNTIDCAGDTVGTFTTLWNSNAHIFTMSPTWTIGIGSHKQGFRLIKTNPINSQLGFLYGYIDYSLTASNDVIIHGWYYEDEFSVPIDVNTLLDYPFDGNCIVYDTTYVTTYDTTYITVTDTLFINVDDASNQFLNLTTIKVYPNPTNDQITIYNGDYAILNNYEIKIVNDLGQTVFSNLITQQTFIVDITPWGSSGTYYLTLYDDVGTALTTRKIVLN